MSSILGGLGSIAEKSAGEAIAFGLGLALGAALTPEGTQLAQEVWSLNPSKAVDPTTAAEIVAEDVERAGWGQNEANQHGIDNERFQAILGEVLNAPGFGELVTMLRRGTITPDDFVHGLRKAKYEQRWDTPLEELQTARLDPAVVAVSGQRGTMENAGLLPVGPPTAVGRVAPMPVSPLDPIAEAAAGGVDRERLAVMMRNVGLPPAPGELLALLNRDVIDETDFYRGVAEGNTRNEWGASLIQLRRRLLTAHEYAELDLRGIIDPAARDAGAALSGMVPADTQLLFELLGRPITVRAITTGMARGGHYGGVYEGVPEPYLSAIRRSSIRPEFGNLAYANRYSYPSAFVLRALTQAGELNAAEAEQILLNIGWEPTLAHKVASTWAGSGGGKADAHVAKAQNQLWATLHKSYVAEETDAAVARDNFSAIAVADAAQAEVLALWDRERELVRATLTPAQIKKAVAEAKFTRAEGIARLGRIGMSAADAGTLLDE